MICSRNTKEKEKVPHIMGKTALKRGINVIYSWWSPWEFLRWLGESLTTTGNASAVRGLKEERKHTIFIIKAFIFNKSGKTFKSEFNKVGNQPIQVRDSYVYLGITFTPSGSISLAEKKLYNKASRSLYSFRSEVNIFTMVHLSQQFLNFLILLWAQSFCATVKLRSVF